MILLSQNCTRQQQRYHGGRRQSSTNYGNPHDLLLF
jgi:hypothetical protein